MPEQNSHIYKTIARLASDIGFGDFGCAEAGRLDADAQSYGKALAEGRFAGMTYLERNLEKRFDPRLLVEGAKTVLCFLVPYGNPMTGIPTEKHPSSAFAGTPVFYNRDFPDSKAAPVPAGTRTVPQSDIIAGANTQAGTRAGAATKYGHRSETKINLDNGSGTIITGTGTITAGTQTQASAETPIISPSEPGTRSPSFPTPLKIASYAWGRDYHKIIKDKLYILLQKIQEMAPGAKGRVFVDSAPVLERAWAVRAGLGFIGKNNFLISRKCGIRNFIGIIITDLELPYDRAEVKNYCGSCTRCLNECPSGALCAPFTLDARKCVSYQTIESKLPAGREPVRISRGGWYFGCDACMDACPWNRKNLPGWKEFSTHADMLSRTDGRWWEHLTEESFAERFRDSPLQRAGLEKIRDSVRTCLEQKKNPPSAESPTAKPQPDTAACGNTSFPDSENSLLNNSQETAPETG